jgi:hypothetical protein
MGLTMGNDTNPSSENVNAFLVAHDQDQSLWINGISLVCQTDPDLAFSPNLPADVTLVNGDGDCYETSVELSATSAIDLRLPTTSVPKPGSRTATFMSILAAPSKIDPTKQVSLDLNRLAWMQEWQGNRLAPPGPTAFYLSEVLADFEEPYQTTSGDPRKYVGSGDVLFTNKIGAVFRDIVTNTTTHVTNDYIRRLLDNGFAVIFAFQYVTFTATKDSTTQKYTVNFALAVTHKVVFCGYGVDQTERFPLRIINVGTGHSDRARLVYDLADRPFDQDVAAQGSGIGSFNFAPGLNRFYLDMSTHQQPNTQQFSVGFADHIDAISLRWQPPHLSWRGGWEKNLTHLVSWNLAGSTLLMTLDSQSHARLHKVQARDVETIGGQGLDADAATCFVSFVKDGLPYAIAYHGREEMAEILHIDDKTIKAVSKFRAEPGYTHFLPVTVAGTIHFVMYKADNGGLFIAKLRPDLSGLDAPAVLTEKIKLGPHMSDFVGYTIDGTPKFVAYDTKTGKADFCSLYTAVPMPDQAKNPSQNPGLTPEAKILFEATMKPGVRLVGLPYLGLPHLFCYWPDTGTIDFVRLAKDGTSSTGSASLWTTKTTGGFQKFFGFEIGTKAAACLYNPQSGEAQYWIMTPL